MGASKHIDNKYPYTNKEYSHNPVMDQQTDDDGKSENKVPWWAWLLIIVVCICLVGVIVGLLIMRNHNNRIVQTDIKETGYNIENLDTEFLRYYNFVKQWLYDGCKHRLVPESIEHGITHRREQIINALKKHLKFFLLKNWEDSQLEQLIAVLSKDLSSNSDVANLVSKISNQTWKQYLLLAITVNQVSAKDFDDCNLIHAEFDNIWTLNKQLYL